MGSHNHSSSSDFAVFLCHHLAVMFRHSKSNSHLDETRPEVALRNRNKLKFKIRTTQLTKVQKRSEFMELSTRGGTEGHH